MRFIPCPSIQPESTAGSLGRADGASLIFPQQNTLEGPSYLIELSLRDRTVQSITAPPLLWDGDFFPAVSPDGRTLAFIRGSEQLARDIYVMSLPDGPVQRITHGCLAMSLAWTEDSSSIVFSSSRNGALSLWRVKATGGDPQRLAAVGDDAYAPAIAKAWPSADLLPRQRHVGYLRRRPGG